jgi:hypothetical protein
VAKIRIKRKVADKLNASLKGIHGVGTPPRIPCDMNGHVLHEGDIVRVYGGAAGGRGAKAAIKGFYSDITNGLILDRYVNGFRSWHGSDVKWEASPELLAKALLT